MKSKIVMVSMLCVIFVAGIDNIAFGKYTKEIEIKLGNVNIEKSYYEGCLKENMILQDSIETENGEVNDEENIAEINNDVLIEEENVQNCENNYIDVN